jgi:hypothetical protein
MTKDKQVCECHGKPIDPKSGTPPYLHRKGYCSQCNVGHPTIAESEIEKDE